MKILVFILLVLVTFSNVLNASTLEVTVLDHTTFEPKSNNVDVKLYEIKSFNKKEYAYKLNKELDDVETLNSQKIGEYKIEDIHADEYILEVSYFHTQIINKLTIPEDTTIELVFYFHHYIPKLNEDLYSPLPPLQLKNIEVVTATFTLLDSLNKLFIKYLPDENICFSPMSYVFDFWTFYYLFDTPFIREFSYIFDDCGLKIYPENHIIETLLLYNEILSTPQILSKDNYLYGYFNKDKNKLFSDDNFEIDIKKQLWNSNENVVKDSFIKVLDSVFLTEVVYYDTTSFPDNLKSQNFTYKDRLMISHLLVDYTRNPITPRYESMLTEQIKFNLNITQPSITIDYAFTSNKDESSEIPMIVVQDSLISYYSGDYYDYFKLNLNSFMSLKIFMAKDNISLQNLGLLTQNNIPNTEIEKYSGFIVFPELNENAETYPNRMIYDMGFKSLLHGRINTSMFVGNDSAKVAVPFLRQNCNLHISSGDTKCSIDSREKLENVVKDGKEKVKVINQPFIYKVEIDGLGDLIVGAYAGPTDK